MKLVNVKNVPNKGCVFLSIEDGSGKTYLIRVGYSLNGTIVFDSELEAYLRSNGQPMAAELLPAVLDTGEEKPMFPPASTPEGQDVFDTLEEWLKEEATPTPPLTVGYGSSHLEINAILRRQMAFSLLKTGIAAGSIKLGTPGDLSLNAFACVKQTDELMRALAMMNPDPDRKEG